MWFNKSPTYSPPPITAQRLQDIMNPNPFIVSPLDEDHFPLTTPKQTPLPPKFPNRVKASISHNEYCILGQVYLAFSNAPQAIYGWFAELGQNAKGVRNTACSLAAVTGLGKETCENAIRMTRNGGEVDGYWLNSLFIYSFWYVCLPNTNPLYFY
jgi:hypothetical protein